jgi:hypothetical protein
MVFVLVILRIVLSKLNVQIWLIAQMDLANLMLNHVHLKMVVTKIYHSNVLMENVLIQLIMKLVLLTHALKMLLTNV